MAGADWKAELEVAAQRLEELTPRRLTRAEWRRRQREDRDAQAAERRIAKHTAEAHRRVLRER